MKRVLAPLLFLLATPIYAQQGVVIGPISPCSATICTTPTVAGGSAASSTLTLESTSGVGTTDAIIFLTASQSERARIVTGGNLGIGTNDPQSRLHVNKNTVQNNAASTSSVAIQATGADSTINTIQMDSFGSSAGYNFLLLRHADGTAASRSATAAGVVGAFGVSTSYDATNYGGVASQVQFVTTETQSSTAQGTRMDFYVTPSTTTTVTLGLRINASTGLSTDTTDPGTHGLRVTGATVQLTALASVATTSAVCYNTGTGLLTYNATVGTCTVSDERLKDRIGPIENALDRLLKIDGFYYTWNDASLGSGRQIGVGAQTVEHVFPELVSTGSDGRKSVDYQRLTAPIIEALRELKAANDNMRTQISDLKKAK